MARHNAGWLLSELPTLVEEGVLSQSAADRLRTRYADAAGADERNWALNVFAVLGAVLVGGGLILVLAHNWDAFSRPLRVVLSLGPLMAAQALENKLQAWHIEANFVTGTEELERLLQQAGERPFDVVLFEADGNLDAVWDVLESYRGDALNPPLRTAVMAPPALLDATPDST